MSSKLIIVADLQHFKLFSVKQSPTGIESVDILEKSDSLDVHRKLSEKVSDRQGNFQSVSGSGSGENHNSQLEEERRRIEEIAKQISQSLEKYPHKSWCFAAPKAINNKIVELLDADVRGSMKTNLHADLTSIRNNELLQHFSK